MREHKYKVWDKEKKRMYENITPFNSWDDNYFIPASCDWTNERFILLQYTGLKDKTSREIYEGDIIKNGLGEIFWHEGFGQFRVRWHDKRWLRIRAEMEEYRAYGSEPLFLNSQIAWEVIGNIYPNPELLEEKK